MFQKSQRLKGLLIIFNLSDSSTVSAVGDNTEKLLHFFTCWVVVTAIGWWSLLECQPQPEAACASGRHLCTYSGGWTPSTKWFWSLLGPGHILETFHCLCPGSTSPTARPQKRKTEFTGGYGKACTDLTSYDYVIPWFQTLELSAWCFPSYHQHFKKGNSRLKN